MSLGDKERRALKPDAQAFDEIHVLTVPRFKTSGLSGDEWRISAKIQFFRKGKLVHESGSFRNVETAAAHCLTELWRATDDGKAYFAGEGNTCDQEGCAAEATLTYKVKNEFCDRVHQNGQHGPIPAARVIRKFCSRHSKRGDYAFDDADSNYELLEGSVAEPKPDDISPSIFGGVVKME